MLTKEELKRQGDFLFRWRGTFPILMLIISILALPYFESTSLSGFLDILWKVFCVIIFLCGLVIRIITICYAPERTSGTNTEEQIADVLNTTGMYSIVRNPLYLGNLMMWFGLSMIFKLWWLSLIVLFVFWLFYERIIIAEEEFLKAKFGKLYLEWSERTPAFIPHLKKWSSPNTTFSFKKFLNNTYKGKDFLQVIALLIIALIIGSIFISKGLRLDKAWATILILGLISFGTIRILIKKRGSS